MDIIGKGRFLRLVRDERGWEYAERCNATGVVVIAAVTDDRHILLIEQYRPPVKKRVVELPAGLVGDDVGREAEALTEAAARELEEETGYRARDWRLLFEGPSSAGLTSETLTLFLATGLERVGEGGGVEGEEIAAELVHLDLADAWIDARLAAGALVDPKVHAALYVARRALGC